MNNLSLPYRFPIFQQFRIASRTRFSDSFRSYGDETCSGETFCSEDFSGEAVDDEAVCHDEASDDDDREAAVVASEGGRDREESCGCEDSGRAAEGRDRTGEDGRTAQGGRRPGKGSGPREDEDGRGRHEGRGAGGKGSRSGREEEEHVAKRGVVEATEGRGGGDREETVEDELRCRDDTSRPDCIHASSFRGRGVVVFCTGGGGGGGGGRWNTGAFFTGLRQTEL